MKNYILLLLLVPFLALADSPKFHFKDCVKVVSGFYINCKGTVEYLYIGTDYVYSVNIQNCKGTSFFSNFGEDELGPSKGCEK